MRPSLLRLHCRWRRSLPIASWGEPRPEKSNRATPTTTSAWAWQQLAASEPGDVEGSSLFLSILIGVGSLRSSEPQMAHRPSGGNGLRRRDNALSVDTIVPIEISDRPGLPKMLDPKAAGLVAEHSANPG